jgi:hypothetical protein
MHLFSLTRNIFLLDVPQLAEFRVAHATSTSLIMQGSPEVFVNSVPEYNHNNSQTLSFSYLPHFEQVDIHENEYPSQDQPRHEPILFR